MAQRDDIGYCAGFAFESGFHGAIAAVAHPARDACSLGLASRGLAKIDALHDAVNPHAYTN